MPRFYQIFETGLSAQSHKQHASAISSYTLAEQKVSKQQIPTINQSFITLALYMMFYSII